MTRSSNQSSPSRSTSKSPSHRRLATVVDGGDAKLSLSCRWKNLLVVASGMLVPIGPTLLLTLQATTQSTASCSGISGSSSSPHRCDADSSSGSIAGVPSTAPAVNFNFGRTWRSYLEAGTEQRIDGSDEEMKRSRDRYDLMEQYLKRWVKNHDDVRLNEQCSNKHSLCVYWAGIGECEKNPVFMEDNCILACQRCHKLIDEEF